MKNLRLWPKTLFGRLTLIWFLALFIAHALNFLVGYYASYEEEQTATHHHLTKDVPLAVRLLEQVPAVERKSWLAQLQRRNYSYELDAAAQYSPTHSANANEVVAAIGHELGPKYKLNAGAPLIDSEEMRLYVSLDDGTPVTVKVFKTDLPLSPWPGVFLTIQLITLTVFTWLAVRQATRPLDRLAQAAHALGSSLQCDPLPEDGPSEVSMAAAAFNAMQDRIAEHLAERMRILAAISHDLQTPITRMRLRADLTDNPALRDKLYDDLNAMQVLVEEGIAYARSAQSSAEKPCRLDLDAFLDSIVGDYVDAGKPIGRTGRLDKPLTTRPHALRRIICNLVDNAFKFGESVEILIETITSNEVAIAVQDRGPGIAEDKLEAVLQPFYRLEQSRNRDTGGTGLGLAIAQQLTLALGGKLVLSNRAGGGLDARLLLPLVD